MKKFLLFLGKFLITFVALWPVPVGFIVYYSIGYKFDIPMWGEKAGYWWPLLGLLSFGFLLCLLSRYKGMSIEKLKSARFSDTIIGLIFRLLCVGLALGIIFWILTLLVVLFHYLFLTSAISVSVPVISGVAILAFLIHFGCKYYNNHSDK